MQTSFMAFILLVAQTFLFAWGASASRGPNELEQATPDSFKIFDVYDKAIAVMDINNDSMLDCLWARRENYDPAAKSVTYVWSLAGSDGSARKDVPFHFTEGDSPDTVQFTVNSDGDASSGVAKFLYTDYENCTIMEVPHFGDECILWLTDPVKDAVPEYCVKLFTDICGNGVLLRDAEKCRNVDI